MTSDTEDYALATLLAQAGMPGPDLSGAVVTSPHFSTTFVREPDNSYRSGRSYGRDDNPTFDAPQKLLKRLEGGYDCLLFSSGMAAATTFFLGLTPGDHVVAPQVMYWALRNWLQVDATRWGLRIAFVDATDAGALTAAIIPGETKVVWVETPANPTWAITDLAHAADAAHAAGAVLAADNTAATPLITRPIEHGADFVMQSGTKYLNGHDNAFTGALVAARPSEHWERICGLRRSLGAIPGTLDAWLLLNGMKTLAVRLERASKSALHIAQTLHDDPRIMRVYYPGLVTHAGHDIARRQMSTLFGGLLSIEVQGGQHGALEMLSRLKLWRIATSFGGTESLIEHRRSVEGENSPASPGLLRLSVGLEDVNDLLSDLVQALG